MSRKAVVVLALLTMLVVALLLWRQGQNPSPDSGPLNGQATVTVRRT
jgi:hypothetical protein